MIKKDEPSLTGQILGNYVLGEKIGEGGFGLVYHGMQMNPVRREVAVKVIRPEKNSSEVLKRFESEKQVLAVMNHPGVCRILDFGSEKAVHPFIVMEFVKGHDIVSFCRDQRSSINDRLKLFVSVCQAVQHAHTKGIVHRDLKPSNILVDFSNQIPNPKIIDFGVAKALDPRYSFSGDVTRFDQIVGTPKYMSPEQTQIENLDIDTRTDVYSLGVILYELLTGVTPVERIDLDSNEVGEVLKHVREAETVKPSTAVGTTDHFGVKEYNHDLASYRKELAGDLDAITMKCLAKDRSDRYQSVLEIAEDIQRYFRNEPVEAARYSYGQQVVKFVGRNRMAVGVAAAFLITLVASTIISLQFALEARDNLAAAQAAIKEQIVQTERAKEAVRKESLARVEKEKQTELAKLATLRANEFLRSEKEKKLQVVALKDYLVETLFSTHPSAMGKDLKVVDLLKTQLKNVKSTFPNQPEIRAEVLQIYSEIFSSQGIHKDAYDLSQESTRLTEQLFGPNHNRTLQSMIRLHRHAFNLMKLEECKLITNRIITNSKFQNIKELSDDERSILLDALVEKFDVHWRLEEGLDASKTMQLQLELTKGKIDFADPSTVASWKNQIQVLIMKQEWEQAEKSLDKLQQELKKQVSPERQATYLLDSLWASYYLQKGELNKSEEVLDRFIKYFEENWSETHVELIDSYLTKVEIELARFHLHNAQKYLTRAEDISKKIFGEGSFESLNLLQMKVHVLGRMNYYDEAQKVQKQKIQIQSKFFGERHHNTIHAKILLASLVRNSRRPDEALKLLTEIEKVQATDIRKRHFIKTMLDFETAICKATLGDPKLLVKFSESGWDELAYSDVSSEKTRSSLRFQLAISLIRNRQFQIANEMLEKEIRRKQGKKTLDFVYWNSVFQLVSLRIESGQHDLALELLKETFAHGKTILPTGDARLSQLEILFARCYFLTGQQELVRQHLDPFLSGNSRWRNCAEPGVYIEFNNFGIDCLGKNEFGLAANLFSIAADKYERFCKRNGSPVLESLYSNLGLANTLIGVPYLGVKYTELAANNSLKRYGPSSDDYLSYAKKTAELYAMIGLKSRLVDHVEGVIRKAKNPSEVSVGHLISLRIRLVDALIEIGNEKEGQKQFRKAREDLSGKESRYLPKVFLMKMSRIRADFKNGRFKECLAKIEQVSQDAGNLGVVKLLHDVRLLTIKGRVLAKLGRAAEGEKVLSKFIQHHSIDQGFINPNSVELLYSLADLKSEIGDIEGSFEVLKTLFRNQKNVFPQDSTVINRTREKLFLLSLKSGEKDNATKYLKKYLANAQKMISPFPELYVERVLKLVPAVIESEQFSHLKTIHSALPDAYLVDFGLESVLEEKIFIQFMYVNCKDGLSDIKKWEDKKIDSLQSFKEKVEGMEIDENRKSTYLNILKKLIDATKGKGNKKVPSPQKSKPNDKKSVGSQANSGGVATYKKRKTL